MEVTADRDEYELDAHSNGTLMSPEEFDAVEEYDRDYRYELIHGVVIVNPIPGGGETSPNDELRYLFRRYAEDHPSGALIDETLPEQYVYLPNGNRRRADRLVWIGLDRAPNLKLDIPAIAIEFTSKSRRDRRRDYEEKRDEYLSLGIQEYWIIDRFRRTMTVFRGTEEVVLKEADTYTTALLPGFTLPLAKLLAFADRYPQ
jgi:Uma2 family endonuclease